MLDYKELFYRSQVEIANAISDLDFISDKLKKCMQKCEQEIIAAENYDEYNEEE